jgi:glucose-1-phosphate adenylyltransferase
VPPFRTTQRLLAIVMAGGRGERLQPLTRDRTKPAVPFGAKYRIIDFTLSNLVNSGFQRIYVLTQYKAQSLLEHLQHTWITAGSRDSFITAVPAQMRAGNSWYRGTADALYQNLDLFARSDPEVVAVFSADHVTTMNVAQMLDHHLQTGATATVACLPVPLEEAGSFGVVEVADDGRITGFAEKPAHPSPMRDRPGYAWVSMGNYIFDAKRMAHVLREDAGDSLSDHDFGRDILPALVGRERVYAYDFRQNRVPAATVDEAAYWRDIGTIDAYYQASLDLKNVVPKLNLYNGHWPVRTVGTNDPPAKFVFDDPQRQGRAVQSVVGSGCIVAGGLVKDSILGRNVYVEEGATIVDSVVLDNVRIGKGARVRRAIIDKNVKVESGSKVDAETAIETAHVTDSGIVVIPRAVDSPELSAWNF